MKTKSVTFNMPVELHWQLRTLVGHKKMSQFVCEAVRGKISEQEKKLKNSYIDAQKEQERNRVIEEWKLTEGEHWQ